MDFHKHHIEVPWAIIGNITINYHSNISESVSVQYDEQTAFGSHGMYATWTGTTPRTFDINSNMVGANALEVGYNLQQVVNAYSWTQESPPRCKDLATPLISGIKVRINNYSANIEDGTYLEEVEGAGLVPIQISLSLSMTECKPI